MRIEIEERLEGVWRPPDADAAGHACEPRIARLRDGTIVLTHRAGTRRDSPDGTPHLLQSNDEGRTWQNAGFPFRGRREALGGDLRGAAIAELASGALLACVIWLDRSDPQRPIYHPETEGLTPVRNLLYRSGDGGRSWAPMGHLLAPIRQLASQGLLVLPDGTVLCTFETFKDYDEPGRWAYRGGLVRSRDEGRSWGEVAISATVSAEGTMWWDPRIARLTDGTLVQCYYAYEHDRGGESPVHIAWSMDDGRSWTPPTPTPLPGQATYPIPLTGNRLLVFQQRRDASQSMVAVPSADGGRTFDLSAELVVHRHEQPSAPAATVGVRPIDYLASMRQFTFGHPCGVALDDDRALLVWYAGGYERTAIHGALVRLA